MKPYGALDRVSSQLHAPEGLPLVHIWYEVGWDPEPVWTRYEVENHFSVLPGVESWSSSP